jgi:hypothetical protein
VFQKQYPIPEMHREYLEKQVQEWLKLSIVQPSRSRYNSPMFLVHKKDGGVRVMQDFRALNANSHDDRYSMKNINECIGDICRAGSTIFPTLDLTSGFWQMPLDEKSKHLTDIYGTRYGSIRVDNVTHGFARMPSQFSEDGGGCDEQVGECHSVH